jgi:two-component system sensor histidine kinase ChvG
MLTRAASWWARGRALLAHFGRERPRLPTGLALRLLAFNVLLVFLPAASILLLDTYEEKLLEAQERSMVQQARVLAAALANPAGIDGEQARAILARLEQRTTARLRVLDAQGWLVADSARYGRREEPEVPALGGDRELEGALDEGGGEPAEDEVEVDPRANLLYRVGAFVIRNVQRGLAEIGLVRPLRGAVPLDLYDPAVPFDGPEVQAALDGRYGAITRQSPGQRSVTLYCALPIRGPSGTDGSEPVVGAVLVTQSTLRLLGDLYETRLAIVRVVVASLLVAGVLSLMVSTTIVRPLAELRRQAAALVDRRGRLRGRFVGSLRRDEVGDLARALEELSRRLGEHLAFIESFAADVSHELKNPLAAVRNATQMLAEVEDPADRRRLLLIAEREIARLERLLGAVREVSELDSRLEGEAREPVLVAPLLQAVVSGLRTRCPPGVGIALREGEGAGELRVLASADRLVQVLDNLLDNAVSFTAPGTEVDIALEREPGGGRDARLLLTVADRGPGIPPEHLEKIFERFFSWRPGQPQAKSRHSGLGLSIVKAIVEGYGGAVAAENRPGGGSVFSVWLPLAPG